MNVTLRPTNFEAMELEPTVLSTLPFTCLFVCGALALFLSSGTRALISTADVNDEHTTAQHGQR